jgi:hypothetical protein
MDKSKGVVNELQSMKWDKEKLTYEIADLKQRAQDITFLKVTRNVQEYLACPDNSAFETQKQRELQMLEATIEKMKQVDLFYFIFFEFIEFIFSVLMINKY